MALLLHIESATEICSVALSRDGHCIALHETSQPNSHSRLLTIMIQQCMSDQGLQLSDLDGVAISDGPGSYTGLRVGSSVAKGICYTLGKPLLAVSTLKALAMADRDQKDEESWLYMPMIDARRMEVYTAIYNQEMAPLRETHPLIVEAGSLEEWFQQGLRISLCGNGAEKCRALLEQEGRVAISAVVCSAKHLIKLAEARYQAGHFEDTAYYEPNYLKAPNITTPKKAL